MIPEKRVESPKGLKFEKSMHFKLKKVDGGFYGHMTAESMEKEVEICGDGQR